LLKHPASGFDQDPVEFSQVMSSGLWPQDPNRGVVKNAGGFPSGILNDALCELFRRAHCLDRNERPNPREWINTMIHAVHHMASCDHCGCPMIQDAKKSKCPMCGKRNVSFKLKTLGGQTISIYDKKVVGRRDLGGIPNISMKHVVFELDRNQLHMVDISSNGTRILNKGKWIVIQKGELIHIKPGDRLKLSNTEIEIVEER